MSEPMFDLKELEADDCAEFASDRLREAAEEIERLEGAVELLRRLIGACRETLQTGGEPSRCLFCLSIKNTYDERGRRMFHHEIDCPYVAAEAFLDGTKEAGA